MYTQVQPVIEHRVRALCTLPYPGHEQGCPHYGKRDICPPNAPLFDQYFDMEKPIFAIWVTFDLEGHVEKLRLEHPDWAEKQLRDWQLWRAETKAGLAREIAAFLEKHQGYTAVQCPEAMGVNITDTASQAGIALEWQEPIRTIHCIALAGVKKE